MTTDSTGTPRTIAEYLDQLRAALRGADPALIQDALYDAEEHLRAELAEQPGRSEADMLARVVGSYGAPEEVAEIYRDQEVKIQRAMRPPLPPKRRSTVGRFFGVAADPRTYSALFYMLLSLATGVFYFAWATTGISLSFGLAVLIIGIPFIVLFFGSVRVLSLVEGRMVESMLGVRMPRRPSFSTRGMSLWKRIGTMFSDPRSWSTLFYMLMMLPLGIVYFTFTVTLIAVSLAFTLAPLIKLVAVASGIHDTCDDGPAWVCNGVLWLDGWPGSFVLCILGVLLLFTTLHIVRGLGHMHGLMAKHLLVTGTAKE
ncbi:sensor domain-containing protein [Dyella caseinilytica]|uniref:Sensor domain-containing protein n=1 Tax=Dyella caseinilytica TaxID=1849581 RepID=A0ABX7GWQ7_9GAMM|nr:sensor domain-containing protein [Dyella caseinilytica]QRN54876.1 sensor domain-containing protein [Dyella caseinilytica]GFZ97604.1 membrane protein [Dyella caseinilytica]